MSTPCTIGSVTFTYPLIRVNPDDPVILGSDVRTKDGNMVSLEYESPVQDMVEKLIFDWEPWSNVASLKAMCKSGGSYSANLGDGSVTVRFARANGVTNVKHSYLNNDKRALHPQVHSKRQDRWTGELNLIIEAP
jgi:hypothetical protein